MNGRYGRGFTCITFETEEMTKKAITFMDGGQIDGNFIKCEIYRRPVMDNRKASLSSSSSSTQSKPRPRENHSGSRSRSRSPNSYRHHHRRHYADKRSTSPSFHRY